ncbi:unnamed protein product [Mytilus coruscus]|uniref:Uncharacterized protein n=1 Tax=Mytilus coruscus TaxID=42192 RepID=A0A6J8DWA6_MYTCO|nr:unnamed protein product [Mytilus coruscus]
MEQHSKRKPNWTVAELDALSKGVAENINMLKGKFLHQLPMTLKTDVGQTYKPRGLLSRYSERPKSMENLSLAEFASSYESYIYLHFTSNISMVIYLKHNKKKMMTSQTMKTPHKLLATGNGVKDPFALRYTQKNEELRKENIELRSENKQLMVRNKDLDRKNKGLEKKLRFGRKFKKKTANMARQNESRNESAQWSD